MKKSLTKMNIKQALILSIVIMMLFVLVVRLDKPAEKSNGITVTQLDQERQALLKEKRHGHQDIDIVIEMMAEKSAEPENKAIKIVLNTETQSQIVTPANPVSRGTSRGNDEAYWLARIIEAEAEGESYIGKVAVGNVIINRVNSSKFPNSVRGVIFDKQDGYTQFSPVLDGRIYNTPGGESINAARAVLAGQRPVGDALYFLNPKKSQSFWITKSRAYMTTIGDHQFYY